MPSTLALTAGSSTPLAACTRTRQGHRERCLPNGQVAAWEVDKPGGAAHVRCGREERSVLVLTAAGAVQWWDTALLKVGL